MAATQRGLGKGLEALLKSTPEMVSEGDIKQLPLSSIQPNQFQPRRHFPEEGIQELAHSIRSQGVLQPVIVRSLNKDSTERQGEPGYELIAGERRVRAAKVCGLETIPAIVHNINDEQSLIYAMIENLQREDLNPIDEASGLATLQKRLKTNQDELARAVGKSRPAVANALRLLHLPENIQDDIRNATITAGHGRAMLAVEDSKLQLALHERTIKEHLSVRQVEMLAAHLREHGDFPEASDEKVQEDAAPRASTSRATKDPDLVRIQKELTANLALRVRLQGTRSKGKMILSFTSEEQLFGLLELLGQNAWEDSRQNSNTAKT